MAGHLGAKELAAVSIGNAFLLPMLWTVFGLKMILTPIVARHRGAEEPERVGKVVQHMAWIGVVVTMLLMLILYYSQTILTQFGVDPSVVSLTSDYLKIRMYDIFPILMFVVLRYFFEGVGNTRPLVLSAAIGFLLNIPLNLILMNGWFGFPKLGLIGIAWATVTIEYVMFFLVLLMAQRRSYARYRVFSKWHPWQKSQFASLLRLGLPSAAALAAEAGMICSVGLVLSTISWKEVTSHQIALNIISLTFMVPLGISSSVASRIGYLIGAKSSALSIRRATYIGLGLSITFMAISTATIFVCAQKIVLLYTHNPDIQKMATRLLYIAAAFQIIDGIQVTLQGILKGFKDTFIPMIMTGVSYWGVGFIVGYVLAIHYHMGAFGFWLGIASGIIVITICLSFRYYYIVRAKFN